MSSFFLVVLIFYISILLAKTFGHYFGDELDAYLEKWPKRLYCLSLSISCLFVLGASFNVLLHFAGITLGSLGVFLASFLLALFFSWQHRYELARALSFCVFESFKSSLSPHALIRLGAGRFDKKIFWWICFISLPFVLLSFSYLYRLTLPIGHQDQLNQYLYDSLQIASLGHLSIPDFYSLGQAFRTDSFASFFDALFIQSVGGWFIPMLLRFFLIILSAGFCATIVYSKSKSLVLTLVFALLALSLPDLWSIGVSGKHDSYIMFLEIVIFVTTSFAFVSRRLTVCLSLVTIAFSLQVAAVASRLSSAALMLIVIPALTMAIAGHLNKARPGLNISALRLYLRPETFCAITLCGMVLLSSSVLLFLNWAHLGNPFYRLSPPGFLSSLFPSADYINSYEEFKNNYNLRIDLPPLISNIATAFYAASGLEVLRFGSRQLSSGAPFLGGLYELLSMVGPPQLIISILSLSPAIFLPILFFRRFLNKFSGVMILSLYVWLLIWTAGIAYTRVFLAGTFLLLVAGLSVFEIPRKRRRVVPGANRRRKAGLAEQAPLLIMAISIGYACIFSLWAATHTLDLRSANGINFDRDQGVTRFLQMTSADGVQLFGHEPLVIPSSSFRGDWRRIVEGEPEVLHLLKGVPTYFAYLADGALIADRAVSRFTPTSYSDVKCYGYSEHSLHRTPCD